MSDMDPPGRSWQHSASQLPQQQPNLYQQVDHRNPTPGDLLAQVGELLSLPPRVCNRSNRALCLPCMRCSASLSFFFDDICDCCWVTSFISPYVQIFLGWGIVSWGCALVSSPRWGTPLLSCHKNQLCR